MNYDDFIERLNRLFAIRQLHYDAFYFFWTSISEIILDNENVIDAEGPLRVVMRRYCHDEGYIDDIIRPVANHDGSLISFKKYTHFGNDFYDLGSIWQGIIIDRDHTAIERTIELLTGYKGLVKDVRHEIIAVMAKEHATFQKNFFDHYLKNNNKVFKEYLKKLSWSIHTMIIAAELLEVLS